MDVRAISDTKGNQKAENVYTDKCERAKREALTGLKKAVQEINTKNNCYKKITLREFLNDNEYYKSNYETE